MMLSPPPIMAAPVVTAPGVTKSMPKAKQRSIKKVAPITVTTPQGTAPRLPWQVWVTYSDGTGEWRQTKWTNSARATEEEQAAYPVGKEYTVEGYRAAMHTPWVELVMARCSASHTARCCR